MGNDRASLEGTALRFACVAAEAIDAADAHKISPQDTGFHLHATLADAEKACADGECVLVVEGDGTIPNRDPYLPPAPVTAAGGYVVRRDGDATLLLLIYRRGAWDLPKGKLDPGETVKECAVREVREEVGIDDLRIVAPAGTTVHGYPEGGRYLVKTTHWYFMETPERDFTPEEREGIEQVEWVPWAEAEQRLGYESLRRHMASLDPPHK
ncbi:MAG: NUDIX hydrolase [Rhodothermales bacterium]